VGAWWPAQRLAVIGLAPLDLAQYYRRPDGSLPDYFAMRAADLAESLYANKSLTAAGFWATSRRGHYDPDVRGKSAGLKMLAQDIGPIW
jgi:hypothetical protein